MYHQVVQVDLNCQPRARDHCQTHDESEIRVLRKPRRRTLDPYHDYAQDGQMLRADDRL